MASKARNGASAVSRIQTGRLRQPEEIGMDSSFVDDLGADSVDLVELVMAMEEEFDVGEIEEDDLTALKTVGDCVRYISAKLSD